MSGPKVVRIVTREEVVEICRGHLARVDATLTEWTRIGRRNDSVDDVEVTAAARRRDQLAALIEAGRFEELQKQAPAEVAFLRNDAQVRLARAAAAQAAARSRARRDEEAARALLRGLRASGRVMDPALESALERGDPEALSRGFALLAEGVDTPRASDELAARFREEGSTRTFASWLAAQPAARLDPAVERIEVRLGELSGLPGADRVPAWRRRLAEVEGADAERRSLLLDGLEVETGRALTDARRRGSLVSDLRLLLAELGSAGLSTPDPAADLETLDAATLELRLSESRASLERHRAANAAAARRAAVIEGLSSLGYEVREGMTTAFAQEGRLVLRSASRPDYGVEVSAAEGAERMQMRPVAFEAGGRGPDPSRDRDAETIWCGDVSSLQERLFEAGGGLRIERALPVGATPLKRIPVDRPEQAATEAAPARRERTIR
jgi:hypothetical protein